MRTIVFAIVSTFLTVFLTVMAASADTDTEPYEELDVEAGGNITGRVTFTGTPPVPETLVVSTDNEACGEQVLSRALLVGANRGIQNAVINLRDVAGGKPWQDRQYTLGQTECRFEPHVLLFREGADMNIMNHDRIAHGVRSYGKDSVFNVGQPKFVVHLLVENFTKKVSEPKVIRIGCDLHPWMKAYVVLQKHPYYAVTDENGSFQLTDVPPGQYELELWHETLGEKRQKVAIEPNGEVSVAFELGN